MQNPTANIVLALIIGMVPGSIMAQSGPGNGYQIKLTEIRTYTGVDNHRQDLGSVGMPLLRLSTSDYPDGIGEVLRNGPNPREISNMVVDQDGVSIPSAGGMTDAVWAWGQFLDHDLDLTGAHVDNGTAHIPVLDMFDPLFPVIFFDRANHLVIDGVREQFNEVTSFMDASMVYGSDDFRACGRCLVAG